MNKDFLNEMLYNESNEKLIKFINETNDREALHFIVSNYNWDAGSKAMKCVIDNENCDLGTALMIFELAGGYDEFYNAFPVHSNVDFLLELKDRINKNDFKTSSIEYIPNLSKVTQYKIKKLYPDINPIFINGITSK